QHGVVRGAPDAVVVVAVEDGGVAGVEGREEHVEPRGGEHGAEGGDLHADVGLGAGGRGVGVADVEAAEHADEAAAGGEVRGARERGGEVEGGRDGDDRHRHGRFLDDVDQATDAVRDEFAGVGGDVVVFEPWFLVEAVGHGAGVDAEADGDV